MLTLEQIEAILKNGDAAGLEDVGEFLRENAQKGELLRRAASNGYLNVVKLLVEGKDHFDLEIEVKIKLTDSGAVFLGDMPPLQLAAYHGFTDIVKYLLSRESLIELQGSHCVTPLYCASRQGHLDLVRLFISHNGMSIEQQTGAINIAAYKGQLEVVKYLFSAGVPADKAMCHAAREGHEDIIRFLLENNVHPDQMAKYNFDSGGDLRMDEIILQGNVCLYSCAMEDKSQLLCDSERDGCDAWDVAGDTPLHLASGGGHISIVKLFLQANASVNAENRCGFTPLDSAVEKGQTAVALLLKSLGGVLNKGGVFLEQAIEKGRFLAVLSLQAMGTDLNFFEKATLSVYGNQPPVPLHAATLNNRINIVQYLLQCNVLVDARDKFAVTSLHYACARGHNEIVNLLVERGASVDTKNKLGECPLSLSLMRGSTASLRYLLENGACPNIRCNGEENELYHEFPFCEDLVPEDYWYWEYKDYNYEWTPLHRAVLKNNIHAAELLIAYGGDVNAINHEGKTPLHNVKSLGMAYVLLKNEAQTLIQDNNGYTPLDNAKSCKRYDIVSLLERHNVK